MALLAQRWRIMSFPSGPIQGAFQEVPGVTTVETGYHVDPGSGDEVIIEQRKVVHNQFGTQFHRTEEYWSYNVVGGPPSFYERLVYTTAWVPIVNEQRQLRLMEHEEVTFWTFSPLADKDNLANTRRLNAFVIEDFHTDPVTIDGDAESKLNEQGMSAQSETTTRKIVHTQRIWREANNRAETIVAAGSRQSADWREDVEYEQDFVFEEIDKWTIWRIKKNSLRPQAVEWEGPRFVKKTGYQYRLPVPIEPPRLSAVSGRDSGVTVTAEGGGAVIDTPNHPGGPHPVRVERYVFYRRIVSEADPDADGDPNLLWDTSPGPPLLPTLIVDGVGGVTPSAAPTTEPHDPAPVDSSDEWSHLGEEDNLQPPDEEGTASILDPDVVAGGVYEYVAIARISRDDSDLSTPARASYTGTGLNSSFRLSVHRDPETGLIEADASPTRDPLFLPHDLGEALSFNVPAAVGIDRIDSLDSCAGVRAWGNPRPTEPRGLPIPGSSPGIGGFPPVEELRCPDWVDDWPSIEGARTAAELAGVIATRWYEHGRQPDYTVEIRVKKPLLGLVQHQSVTTPSDVSWRSFGEDMDVESSAEVLTTRLKAFKLGVEMDRQGRVINFDTILTLVVR